LCVAEPPCGSVVLLLHHHVDRQRRRQCQAPEWLHRGWGEVHDVGVGVGEQFGGEASPLLGDTSHLVRRAVEDGEVLRPPVLGSYLSDARPGRVVHFEARLSHPDLLADGSDRRPVGPGDRQPHRGPRLVDGEGASAARGERIERDGRRHVEVGPDTGQQGEDRLLVLLDGANVRAGAVEDPVLAAQLEQVAALLYHERRALEKGGGYGPKRYPLPREIRSLETRSW